MFRRRACFTPLLGSALAGCSLLTDLSGLSNGAAPSLVADGSTDAGADGLALTDAPIDADAESFCSRLPRHDLCADFDQSDQVGSAFDTYAAGGGSMTLSSASPKSSPRSLVASMPGVGAGRGPGLVKRLVEKGARLRCELDVRREGTGSDGSFALLRVDLEGTDGLTFALEMKQSRTRHYFFAKTYYVDGGGTQANIDDAFPPPAELAWTHYVLEIDTSKQRLLNLVDEVTALDRAWPLPSEIAAATIEIGLTVVSRGTTTWSQSMDNVVCDILP